MAFAFGPSHCCSCCINGFMFVVLTEAMALPCRAPRRVRALQPGNFHLLAQMKVTKAKGLNTI